MKTKKQIKEKIKEIEEEMGYKLKTIQEGKVAFDLLGNVHQDIFIDRIRRALLEWVID